MPYRKVPLVVGETYHFFNRSVAGQPIFDRKRDCQRAIETIEFYLYKNPPLRFSHYDRLPAIEKQSFLFSLRHHPKQIDLSTFCLMPNHLHFLAKQKEPNGIATFMRNLQNSFARYHNTKYKRSGALFQSMFKAIRIETNEQLLHVQRYIHLNPVTSYTIKQENGLGEYPWSSYPDYLGRQLHFFINPDPILKQFSTIDKFKQFITDQIDYQRQLNAIKHLLLE